MSHLLEKYLSMLKESPMRVTLQSLAYNSQIPESIFRRLMNLHHDPADASNISAEDYHILFSNIMFRFPTVKMWLADDGAVIFEM